MPYCNLYATDNNNNKIEARVQKKTDRIIVSIPKESIDKNAKKLFVLEDAFTADINENGFYLGNIDFGRYSAFLTYFKEREDFDYYTKFNVYNMFGVKNNEWSVLAVITGMPYDYKLHISKKSNKYHIGMVFDLERIDIYEDITIELLTLADDATFIQMAKRYRKYQLEEKGCIPIKKRIKYSPVLEYAKESVEIRIRQGWKPAPPEILEQTIENEPPMHTACDFDRVKDIIDALKSRGVIKAELCLVGWNISGHDGRWPDTFPVEPALGGEAKLKQLIKYAQQNGYRIVCHSNSTDCYSISEIFNNKEITLKSKDGKAKVNPDPWSGGTMYWLCPQRSWEFAQDILPQIAALGFCGLHYIDVMSIIEPRTCFDDNHPCNARQSIEYYEKIAKLCHELFGGFSSEGGFDYLAKYLDYALYTKFNRPQEICMDEGVPFWELTYHGIIMSNAGTNTVNYIIKTPEDKLQMIESGNRPVFYLYSKFMNSGNNWMGNDDMVCDTDEQLKKCADDIKKVYDEYQTLQHLQTEFIEDFKVIEDGLEMMTYSNGTRIIVNYNDLDCYYQESKIAAKDYIVLE